MRPWLAKFKAADKRILARVHGIRTLLKAIPSAKTIQEIRKLLGSPS